MAKFVVSNACVIPMLADPVVIDRGCVVVEDGEITYVGAEPSDEHLRDAEVVDAKGQVLMPGIVNAHTHLYQVLLRGVWGDLSLIPWLKKVYHTAIVLNEDDCRYGAILGSVEALLGGVTSVCEHHFLNPSVDHTRASIEGILSTGIRSVMARTVMNDGDLAPECVLEKSDDAFRQIETLMAEFREEQESGLLWFATGPNTPPINTDSAIVRDIVQFSKQAGIGISSHVAESRAVLQDTKTRYGYEGVVEYLHDLGMVTDAAVFAHCVHLTDKDISLMAETGASVSHNPVSNMFLGDGIAPVIDMLRSGVNVALGTDGAASNFSQDMFETMKVTSLLQRVAHEDASIILPYEVLRMATIGGAKALGIDHLVGTLEVGKRADMILIDLQSAPHNVAMHNPITHLVHCAKATDVTTVFVDGKVVVRDRQVVGVDQEALLHEAQVAAEQLLKRIDEEGI